MKLNSVRAAVLTGATEFCMDQAALLLLAPGNLAPKQIAFRQTPASFSPLLRLLGQANNIKPHP